MNCEELLAALSDYVDRALEPGLCEAFEEHLKGCNPCELVVDNIRNTIALFQQADPYQMPQEFHHALNRVLRERWHARFPGWSLACPSGPGARSRSGDKAG
ncbi:MAG: anti-sigma factor family protein [Thermoguttaceae bacterium]